MTKPKQRHDESDDEYALRLKEYKKRFSEYIHKRWITMTAEKREKRNAQRRKRYAEDENFRAKQRARCREDQFKRRLMIRYNKPKNDAFVDYIENLGMHTICISRTKKDVSKMTLQELIETQNDEF